MSPCYTDGKGSWICTGSNNRFIVRTRRHGYRRYQVVSKHRSRRAAITAMAAAFANGLDVKRADVLMEADYYDTVQLCELVRT